jgi:LmbE family N-acetylglucosaminyl deacetylase
VKIGISLAALASILFVNAAFAADGIESVQGKTVMVVQAHPDDAESRCAGTVALLKKHGNRIIYVVATRDDKGFYDVNADPGVHAALRKREEEEAVKVLKIDVLEWLGYDDGWLDMVPHDKLRGDVVRMMRKHRPDILMAFDPRNADEHMDHRAVAFASMDAVTAAPFPLYYADQIKKDGLSPHQVQQIYYYDTLEPNVWVDIQETIEIKIDALAKHVSQKGADRAKIAEDMKSKAWRDGAAKGIRFAESLRAADLYIGVTPASVPKFRAGLSRTEITPPVGYIMGGYGARKGVSTGVHDPLTATVLYLECGAENLALVALDLRSFPSEHVLKRAKEELGVRHVLLASSHTHSGPITWEKQDWPTPESPWFRDAEDRIVEAIAKARNGAFPAHIEAGSGAAYIGHNRRLVQPDGSVTMFWRNPDRTPTQPLDPTVRLLRIADMDGKIRAVGVNYACHGVNLGPDNLEISADWPGYMRREIEQELGNGALCFFLQGASGDINPYLDKQPVKEGGFAAAQESGHIIAAEALRILKRMRPAASAEGSIEVGENLFEVPNRWMPSQSIPIGVSTVVLNKNIAFVAVPGEAFVELQKSLADQSPLANTFFLGYCYSAGGVWAGYLPTIRASTEGGYGAGYNTDVAVGTGEKVIRQAVINLYRTLGRLRDIPER